MDHPVLQVAMRYVHVVSAIMAVGGMSFILICLVPSLRLLDDTLRGSLDKLVHHRFLRLVWASIAGLTISGAYNWYMLAGEYKAMGKIGNALIGTKVLLAVIMFAVVGARSAGLITNQRAALMINIHLAAIVILLGSVLRYYRLEWLHQNLQIPTGS
jgi:uncharacterized membrane protein